jgi:hypothetical protein
MPVVNGKSDLIRDPRLGEAAVDPSRARGRPICITGTVLNLSTDSNLSRYQLAELPSDCILDSRTAFDVENWGFAAIRIGTRTSVAALVSVLKSAGVTHNPVVFGDARHNKLLWEVLGFSVDPERPIGLWAHAIANSTGDGNMPFEIHYRYR